MKISHKDLKELFKSYLEDRIPSSRAECPLPRDITACLRAESSKKKREQIIDHVFQCAFCRQEFEFVLETIREEKKLINDLSTIIKGKRHSKENKTFRLFPFRFSWLYSLILITGIVLITILLKNISEEHKYRSSEFPSVTLITSNKKTIQKKQPKFEWEYVQNSDYYILEIFDESLYPIWESDKITANHTVLSKEITNRLLEQKTYYWMVTAFLSDGRTIESRLQDFRFSE